VGQHQTRRRGLRPENIFHNAKLSVFKSIFVPVLTYGQESRVMIEGMLSQVQAAEIGFLKKTCRDGS